MKRFSPLDPKLSEEKDSVAKKPKLDRHICDIGAANDNEAKPTQPKNEKETKNRQKNLFKKEQCKLMTAINWKLKPSTSL